MKIFSIVLLFSYIWFVFWQFFVKNSLYPNLLELLSFLAASISMVFLIQSLSISYYWRMFATQELCYKLYSFICIPLLLITFQYIMLVYSMDKSPYQSINIWVWIVEFILLAIFISPLMLLVGEEILPRLDPQKQLIWTKKFPPERIDDMYRGFFVVLVFFLMPPLFSLVSP